MKRWWEENGPNFESYGLSFDGHAVIVARERGFPQEYRESAEVVRQLIRRHGLAAPWRIERRKWLMAAIKYIYRFLKPLVPLVRWGVNLAPGLTRVLITHCELNFHDAR
ncbi:hypothetical protein JAAARDRAFT_259620 [Jaapia argillacea MUCL 33604]|uniref:Uncharacterized protein n=1 Tax=Jaapia argillacea MUCL 33604 TaxID=933084 RepID=A0A067PTW7_9AGAM|nr:hypothetical protein JAAARDRAFT_259620 [Jaapia argillacea MUCL 33604]